MSNFYIETLDYELENKIAQAAANEVRILLENRQKKFKEEEEKRKAINEKLLKCKAEMLLSSPCFEIWLLLHAKDQKTAIDTDALIKELKKSAHVWKNYSKSAFTDTQKTFLNNNTDVAVARAKGLKEFQNPSTGIYRLIEMLREDVRQ